MAGEGIPRQSVESSMLRSIGYAPEKKWLEVEFTSGKVYRYYDVDQNTYDELMQAGSHGSYFSANIRGAFQYEEIRS